LYFVALKEELAKKRIKVTHSSAS